MIRKYKSWSGLSLVTLLGLVAIIALVVLLIKGFLISQNVLSLIVILVILLIVSVAYANYITLQLRKRAKEFYLRKLLGARDIQIMLQILLESTILTSFMVISGMVVAELISPLCGDILGVSLATESLTFWLQLVMIFIIVIPVGVLAIVFPVKSFIKYVKDNITHLSYRKY
ncbi:MAG: FtsX-like permease family protein [Bacteroidota bacterium]